MEELGRKEGQTRRDAPTEMAGTPVAQGSYPKWWDAGETNLGGWW